MEIVIVHFIFQALFANLVKAMKLVQVNGVAVRHNHPVEDNGHAALLAKSRGTDLAGLPQHNRPIWDEHMLVIVRVNGIGDQYLDRADSIAVQPIHQNSVHRQPLINHIRLSRSRVDIDFGAMLNRRLTDWNRSRASGRSRHSQAAVRLRCSRIRILLGNVFV